MLKYEPCIKHKELHDKEQNIYTVFFYFYVLKDIFHEFVTKGSS